MSDIKSLIRTKITNPLDELFNTLPHDLASGDDYEGTTEGVLAEIDGQDAMPEKDEEDVTIDANIDTVYDAALTAFNNQTAYMEIIEPRYAARNAEVAANYLNIALNAMSVRSRVKGDRKKTAAFVPFSNNKTSGSVVASREDLLKMLAVEAEMKSK